MASVMRRALLLLLLVACPVFAQAARDVTWRVEFASQEQPGWRLANSRVSFAEEGCYVTSLWMLKHSDGEFRGTLAEFNRWLAAHAACDPNGDLRLWMQDELGIVRVDASPERLNRILQHRPVIAKSTLNGGHFYVIYGRQGDTYLCDDPGVGADVRRTYEELGLMQIRDLPSMTPLARY